MADIIEQSDFVGEFQLTQNINDEVKILDFIQQHAPYYIRRILGVELGNAFIADLDVDGEPTEARFTAIYDAFQFDDGNDIKESAGMKETIKAFVYFEIARVGGYYHSTEGIGETDGENSVKTGIRTKLASVYNQAVEWADVIQWYVDEHNPNDYDYDDYNGQLLAPIGLF